MRRLAVIALLGLVGCITPSIPIPPPDPAKMEFHLTVVDIASTAVLTYPPTESYKGGIAYLFNRKTGEGVIQTVKPTGAIGPTPALAAHLADEIVVSVENDQQTVSTCIVLKEGAQDSTTYCGP